ncbi:MAG: preprotein translocase subunit SecG [Elusimicrobiota bacterium]|mgnify:CR=1 FL=1
MYHFLLTVHVIACLFMILFVLLQTGRGAGLSMFGGGGDSLINTPSGSNFMKKFTAGLAATFAVTSLFLTLLSDRTGMSSVTSKAPPRTELPAAASPAPAPSSPAAEAASKDVSAASEKSAPVKKAEPAKK